MPVSPKEWCQSSSGAWFTIIPVTHSPAQAPDSGSKGVGCGAAPMDTHDAPLSKEPTLLRSGDVLMSTDDTAPPVRGASQEMCDAKAKPSAAGAIMGIDWSTVRDMCDQGLVPLPEVRFLYSLQAGAVYLIRSRRLFRAARCLHCPPPAR